VQWARRPGGQTSPEFAERIRRLLSPQTSRAADAPYLTPTSTPTGPAVASRAVDRWRRGAILVAAAAIFALAYFGLDRWVLFRHAVSGAGSKSVAVLPLKNESGDPSQQYFSDGISEDLITALSHVPGLKVIGRTSSFHFRDSKEDSRTIGEQLGVAHLIEGSVRRAGNTVRVSAELINAPDGSTMWSERYDRPYQDLFALQDEITQAVALALKTRLLSGAQAAVKSDRPPSGSLEAYNAYLQGKYLYLRQTEQGARQAIEHFTRATELDPRYAQAWSGQSRAWRELGGKWVEGAPMQEAYAKSRAAAETAKALAPDAVETHLAWGYLQQFVDFDQREAEASYRRAVELAPDDSETKALLADELATLGQVEKAVALMREALALDPLRAVGYSQLAVYLLGLNRLDEAEQAIRKAITLQPSSAGFHATLVLIEIQRGDAKAALTAAQQELAGAGWDRIALAQARQIGGDRAMADAALKTLIDHDAKGAAYQIAQAYALRNDAKETFAWLDRAWSNRDGGILNLSYDPFILRYKDDPRFAAFCKKVGLPTPAEVGKRT